ncbi:50S ribosomal protein L15 [uncultured archaeon]|nr:50S ribosomal protein L15 [uncultured archaeon]
MAQVHKRKKSTRMHGRAMGTHGWGARKKHKKSGHRGGKGMAGTGKRADQKKTLMTKLYGNSYFGKQGITSKSTKRDKRLRINLQDIENRLQSFIKEGIAKKTANGYELNLSNYKILGDGEVKNKLMIQAFEASNSAIEKVKKAGGEIKVREKKVMKTPVVENPKKKKAPEKKK